MEGLFCARSELSTLLGLSCLILTPTPRPAGYFVDEAILPERGMQQPKVTQRGWLEQGLPGGPSRCSVEVSPSGPEGGGEEGRPIWLGHPQICSFRFSHQRRLGERGDTKLSNRRVLRS